MMSLLDITNSFLFEREVRFPDDRSIAKNPNHDCPPKTNTLGNQKLTQGFLYRFKCVQKMRVIEHTRYIDYDEGRNEGNDDNHSKACVSLGKKFGL